MRAFFSVIWFFAYFSVVCRGGGPCNEREGVVPERGRRGEERGGAMKVKDNNKQENRSNASQGSKLFSVLLYEYDLQTFVVQTPSQEYVYVYM